ncbi:MAG: PilZ domain-containing protein [Acidobacteria bacterium]|nr:PilZ domain-containing protein [Acidobacteriota bacterium]
MFLTSTSKSGLAKRFLWFGLLAGALPLGLQALLFLRRQSVAGSQVSIANTIVATLAGALALLVLSWALSGRLWRALESALRSVQESITRVTGNDFGARAEINGPGSELARLGRELNDLLESRQREILNLTLEGKQAVALRESSRQLIEACIYAREPLAKQHPGLAGAYAAAAIRKAGHEKHAKNPTLHGLVEGVDRVGPSRDNRENLRWTPKELRVEVPMPSKLVNMSISGMAVESNRGLPVGGSWIFRVGTDAIAYEIPGKICWCRLQRTVKIDGEVRPIYRTGVEFDDLLSGKAFDFFGPAALEAGTATSVPS